MWNPCQRAPAPGHCRPTWKRSNGSQRPELPEGGSPDNTQSCSAPRASICVIRATIQATETKRGSSFLNPSGSEKRQKKTRGDGWEWNRYNKGAKLARLQTPTLVASIATSAEVCVISSNWIYQKRKTIHSSILYQRGVRTRSPRTTVQLGFLTSWTEKQFSDLAGQKNPVEFLSRGAGAYLSCLHQSQGAAWITRQLAYLWTVRRSQKKTQRNGENIKSLQSPWGLIPGTFLLWGDSANHRTTHGTAKSI